VAAGAAASAAGLPEQAASASTLAAAITVDSIRAMGVSLWFPTTG
jgi:hypothetical protein